MATTTTQDRRVTTGAPPRPGFRPSARSRVRIALGTLLALMAIGAILLIFSTADKRAPVMQATRDIPAGSMITADMFRPIEVSADPSLTVVPLADVDLLVGQYAKVRIIAGSLLSAAQLQPGPLVAVGSSVVAIEVKATELPIGLRERSRVAVVFRANAGDVAAPPVEARVVGLPIDSEVTPGDVSVSLELSAVDATTVAGFDNLRLVLLDPAIDPADQP